MNAEVSERQLQSLKNLYDFSKSLEERNDGSFLTSCGHTRDQARLKKLTAIAETEKPLENLIVKDFDEEQIWEELQLQNTFLYDSLVSSISKLVAHCNLPRKKPSKSKPVFQQEEGSDDDEEEEDDLHQGFNEDTVPKEKRQLAKRYSRSIVDDKFFNLSQMTEFLENVEAELDTKKRHISGDEDQESDEESIDLFNYEDTNSSVGSEEEEHRDYFYKEFFDPPIDGDGNDEAEEEEEHAMNANDEPIGLRSAEEPDESDDEEVENEILRTLKEQSQADGTNNFHVEPVEEEMLSNFEKTRRKIESNIEEIEEDALKPKPWHLQGEVTAQKRPENSLLEKHLTYDHLARNRKYTNSFFFLFFK